MKPIVTKYYIYDFLFFLLLDIEFHCLTTYCYKREHIAIIEVNKRVSISSKSTLAQHYNFMLTTPKIL
jgi:hypothetical protein